MTIKAEQTQTRPIHDESLSGLASISSQANKALVSQIVQKIVVAVKPSKIILFGSMTRSSATQVNDMDLLVVVADGASCSDTAKVIYHALHAFPFPVDVVVATPKLLDTHRNNIGLIYHNILKEGLEIYAA